MLFIVWRFILFCQLVVEPVNLNVEYQLIQQMASKRPHAIHSLHLSYCLILYFVPHFMEQIKRTKQFPLSHSQYKFRWLCEVQHFILARAKFGFFWGGWSNLLVLQISNIFVLFLMKLLRKQSIIFRGRFVKNTHWICWLYTRYCWISLDVQCAYW